MRVPLLFWISSPQSVKADSGGRGSGAQQKDQEEINGFPKSNWKLGVTVNSTIFAFIPMYCFKVLR